MHLASFRPVFGATSVFDVAGTNIGRLVGYSYGAVWDTLTIAVSHYVFTIGETGDVTDQVMYTGLNCTGTPFAYAMNWYRNLGPNRLTVTYEEESTELKFFEFADPATTPTLKPQSMLSDGSNEGTDGIDGRGNCTNFSSGWIARPSRVLREIPAPVKIDTSGPLTLLTPP